jgi:hypothetical protein
MIVALKLRQKKVVMKSLFSERAKLFVFAARSNLEWFFLCSEPQGGFSTPVSWQHLEQSLNLLLTAAPQPRQFIE